MASDPEVEIVTSLTYQPWEPGVPEVTDMAAEGPVLSTLTVMGAAFVVSPAPLVQDPLKVAPDVSLFCCCKPVQVTGPLIASVPVVVIVALPAYQPWAPGVPETERMAVGGVASRLMVTEFELLPPALVALQVKVAPVVSVLTLAAPQPEVEVTLESGSVTIQPTLTFPTYQPSAPAVPVTLGVMTGGVLSQVPVTVNEMLEVVSL